MASDSQIWASDLNEMAERETRTRQALLRGVTENLKSNRVVVPLFGLAICGIFRQWVSTDYLIAWYCQMMIGLVPQLIVLARIPQYPLTSRETQKWTWSLAAANLFFVANWASLGLWFWSEGDKNANHILISADPGRNACCPCRHHGGLPFCVAASPAPLSDRDGAGAAARHFSGCNLYTLLAHGVVGTGLCRFHGVGCKAQS